MQQALLQIATLEVKGNNVIPLHSEMSACKEKVHGTHQTLQPSKLGIHSSQDTELEDKHLMEQL